MIRFRSWLQHNRRIIKEVLRRRGPRGVPLNAPLSLERVVLASRLDQNFADFASKVGGNRAETVLVRTLQYAAEHDGIFGTIAVPKARFGPVVLSVPWDTVRVSAGVRAYEALLSSNICVPYDGDWTALWTANETAFRTAVQTADKTAPILRPASSSSPTPPGRGGSNGKPAVAPRWDQDVPEGVWFYRVTGRRIRPGDRYIAPPHLVQRPEDCDTPEATAAARASLSETAS